MHPNSPDNPADLPKAAGQNGIDSLSSPAAGRANPMDYAVRVWEATFDAIPDLIAILDENRRIVRCNKAMVEAFGRPREEIEGRVCWEVFHDTPCALPNCPYTAVIRECRPHASDIFCKGLGRMMEISVAPICENESGAVIGCVHVAHDLTARKNMESALKAEKERTDAASQAKSDFLANLSHELRTPISGVIGALQVILSASPGNLPLQEQRALLQMSLDSSLGLLALLNDVLDISKIEAGKFRLESRPFQIVDALERTLAPLRFQAQRKGLDFVSIFPAQTPSLLGDPDRLGQIVTNLASNAIKFTDNGHVRIELAIETPEPPTVPPSALAVLTVQDTGPGIAAVARQAVFEDFFQVTPSSRPAGPDAAGTRAGTGLGLAISRRLARLMGGDLTLTSELGKGSRFTLRLPLTLADNARRATASQDQPTPAPAPATLPGPSRGHILLVEDVPLNRVVISRMLAMLGYESTAAEDAPSALDLLAERSFDLALMDVQMPGMDGLEAVRLIRSGDAGALNPDMPILALTAQAMPGDRERALEAGMNGYLTKPVELDALQEALESTLGLREEEE